MYYYIDDMLGSSRTIVKDGQTSACYEADFYPFGGERDINVSCVQNYKFEAKERDGETGNDDFGARYYSNRFGRWLSADWSATPEPVPYANLTNPQTLNLYAMVSDNPETFADLDGHCAEDACVVEGAVGGVGILVYGAVVGTGAVLSTPAGQRSVETFTSAAGNAMSSAFHGLTHLFSKSTNSGGSEKQGTQSGSKPKDVYIDPSKYPAAAGHAADAQAAGHPDTLTVDRGGAADRRADATAGHATQSGTDRDEYPPAVTAEGGKGASIRDIPSSDNRGAGASMGQQIKDVPDGGKIRIVPSKKPQ